MNHNRLQVGIDFSRKRADFCLLFPDGQPLLAHQACANSRQGYEKARQVLLDSLQAHTFDCLDVSGEATSYYWFPFFWQLAHDAQLGACDLNQFLLNPRQVRWFKKSLPPDDKDDQTDPFYIAERTRTRRPKAPWDPQEAWLPLRFYTRLRFHLAQALTREKNYYLVHLFLLHNTYRRGQPFSDPFGVTSQKVLGGEQSLSELVQLPLEALAEQLDAWSGGKLDDPLETAQKLQQVAQDSFPLEEPLLTPVQHILELTLEHIRFLEVQIEQVEGWIAAEVQARHPEVAFLDTIPGVGLVLAAGIAAEIGDLGRFFQTPKWDKQRKRYRKKTLREVEDAVAKLAGLWWPKADSGEFVAEDRRLAKTGNRYLRYYFVQAAGASTLAGMRRHIPAYARFYSLKFREATRHKHKRALVLTARKSIGLFVGLLHRKEAYRSKEA